MFMKFLSCFINLVGPQVLQYGLKALYLSLGLLFVLLKQRISPKFVLVQVKNIKNIFSGLQKTNLNIYC